MQATKEFVLDDDLARFVTGGVSIIAASRDAANRPQLVRALGCRLSSDRREITLLLSAAHSESLIGDWLGNDAIAVVFTQPSTHRSVQIKGGHVARMPLGPEDEAYIGDYRDALASDLASVGFSHAFTQALLSCPDSDRIALRFVPTTAFCQTPGPGAGEPLRP